MLSRGENGQFQWEPTAAREVMEFVKGLGEAESGNLPMTYELKQKLDQALKTLAPRGGVDAMADANRRLYGSLKHALGKAPGAVDIILPVHNAIHITRKCIQRVLERTQWPFHLYVVDDASDAFTHAELERLAEANKSCVTLITNLRNKGFAATVNRGIREGKGEYVCLLNSDVFVTDLWLSKMMLALLSEPRNKIVCPVTNNTAIVDVPMSPGASYLQMNQVLESFAQRRYPELMPTGFCFLFPREMLFKIGYFDEAYFSYGEESDWWWKTIRYAEGDQYQRYRAVLADDTYVFHERGSSFSQIGNDTHMHYRKLASSRFNKLWPEWVTWKNTYDVSKAMGGLREKIPATLLRGVKDRYRVCWVVHDAKGSCGGMKYIADVVNEMIEQGINAKVAVIKRREQQPEVYLGELCTAPIFFSSREEFIKEFPTRVFPGGILIGATSELSPVIQLVGEMSEGRVRPLLHAQSYEPEICVDPNDKEVAKSLFTRVPDIISNAKWVTKAIKADTNMQPLATIHPGVDTFLFYQRDRSQGDERPTLLLPMNPHYPCKGFNRGLELIAAIEFLATQRKLDIRILVYGCESLPVITQAICQGDIPQMRVATLLGTEVDAFVDPSLLHSYGMPALEAAASGVKVFSWDNKGIKEYAEGAGAEVYPNDLRPLDMARVIVDYLADPAAQREYQKKYAVIRAHITKYHNREESVQTLIKQVEKHFNLNFVSRRICMLVPHLRKHGGPTTMLNLANELQAAGHKVGITTVYADVSPEVVGMTHLPVNVNAQKIPPCDLIITNSDNPMVEAVSRLDKVKKSMLKLSHNPRFRKEEEKGLQQKWDAIVTSTDWLVDVCKNPTEGWEYLSCDAERIGWWNYAFGLFQCAPDSRTYGMGTAESPVTIGTLIHAHPSKGSREAIEALGALTMKYGPHVRFIGVGEVPPQAFRSNLPNFEYRFQLSREQMAKTMQEMDIWIGASHSEGLGRMGLEAMSASVAVVSTNTSAEYMRDRANCLLVPIGDSRALAAAVSTLVEQPELAQMIRMRGFETAASLADPAPTIGALQKVIARVFA